ncbi:N-acetylmuramoyl-L-alanine amidase [candidate division TA06 bacterium]|nr:N-acetylmuramoyl-L-alanine amidase [candidate division TA06 bacterium]
MVNRSFVISASPRCILFFVFLFFFFILPYDSFAKKVEVLYQGRTISIQGLKRGKVDYLFGAEWARVVGGTLVWDGNGRSFSIQVEGHEVVFIPENPFVRVDGSLEAYPLSSRLEKGEPLIPFEILGDLFDLLIGRDIRWFPSKRRLVVEGSPRNIRGVNLRGDLLKTEVILKIDGPLRLETTTTEMGRLILRIEGGRMRPEEFTFSQRFGALRKMEGEQLDRSAKILFHLEKGFEGKVESDSEEIRITFTPMPKEKREKGIQLEVIVLDPGHGGKDPGAVSPKGVKEKDIVLAIAKKVKRLLEKRLKVKVVMTRNKDIFIPLSGRAEIAEKTKADLFVSIHCNASPKRRRSGGVETYFLSVAKTDWARAVEARENAVLLLEEHPQKTTATLQSILSDMAQIEFLNESSHLAEMVQEEMAKRVPIENRGINQAGFYVLSHNYCPAILVETAFLTNAKEERLLKQRKFQEKIAEGIYQGIKKFKSVYEERLNQ